MSTIKLCAFSDEASPSIDAQIVALKRNGMSGIEIRNVDGENISVVSLAKAHDVRSKLDTVGLCTWAIASPIGKSYIELDDFESELDKLKHTIDLAQILGTENIRIFSYYMPYQAIIDDYHHKVIDRLGKMADIANNAGITLCHENEKGIYGDIPQRCVQIHKALPSIRGIFDPANYIQCGCNTLDSWDLVHPYIKYHHIKDANASLCIVPAGEGIGNLPELIAAYRSQGGVWLSIEPHLVDFIGFSSLERHSLESRAGCSTNNENDVAFDIACSALKKLIL